MFDFGAMTMPAQIGIVQALIDDAKAKGARVLHGGGRPAFVGAGDDAKGGADGKEPYRPGTEHNGTFFEPTLLVDVTHEMRVANEEAFGPIMTVIKFKSED